MGMDGVEEEKIWRWKVEEGRRKKERKDTEVFNR